MNQLPWQSSMRVIHDSHPWNSSMKVYDSQISTVSHFQLLLLNIDFEWYYFLEPGPKLDNISNFTTNTVLLNIVQGLSGSSTNLETLNVSRLINFVQKLHEWGWLMNERESISTITTNEPIFTVLLNDFIPHGMSATHCTVHCLPKWLCCKYTSPNSTTQFYNQYIPFE